MAKQRKAVLTSRQFRGLRTMYNQPPKADDQIRIYRVTDNTGTTKKASSNEKYVADALEKFSLEFTFQMPVGGGRSLVGGLVLDFLVMTVPRPTPVWVHGEHWHQGSQRAKDIKAMQTVDEYGKGEYAKGIEIWGDESENPDKAARTVRRKIL